MTWPIDHIDVEPAFDRCIERIGGQRVSDRVGPSPEFNNADYMLAEHAVVAELKCLEENKGNDKKLRDKVHHLYNEYLSGGKANLLIYGAPEANANDVSLEFGREVMELYRIPIHRVVEKANRQIRQTKTHLRLEDYHGILLLVNDGHEHLSPDQVKWILANTFKRQSFSSIDTVVFFTVNLKARHPDFEEDLLVWAVMERPGHKSCSTEFHDQLRSAWIDQYQAMVGPLPVHEYVFEDSKTLSGMENVRIKDGR